ncbi:urea ABC transporter permease subunit UrtB [Rubrimonas cliftonensis]|uniref:Amino acid/amide ABC transporter membrane protein 1, HAAT family n=1 Tax=Rubrimonas cliftonensis TaxID=89524 RepID=A0A1H4C5H0_9RHOB|nr:urea ABC transporter permease subunit UrtB [Rubrimonas cliftonensis]SEA55332.1 amino acid/amide ABC transporter membrane protein 1, HAAT family [Rubrimonas cliftonensis]
MRSALALLASLFLLMAAAPILAQTAETGGATLEALAARLPDGDFNDRAGIVSRIAATSDPRAAALLDALLEGELERLNADGRIVRVTGPRRQEVAFDALTGEEIGPLGRGASERIRVNNAVRRAIRSAVGVLTLGSPDPAVRISAAQAAFSGPDPEQIEPLSAALAAETDPAIAKLIAEARAASILADGAAAPADKVAALDTLTARGDRAALSLAIAAQNDPAPEVAAAAGDTRDAIERVLAFWDAARNVWFGISLGSVLMLAAIGLAITFGVMGVINMAHGELVMLGAYTTFAVQQAIVASAPWLSEWTLAFALPLAFLVSGSVGVAIERGVCRFLYGRPLETLLATWGVSLILQQLVRSIFGATNRAVSNPDWMSGAFQIGQMQVTWNRFWIVLFALAVFAALTLLLKRTPMGLQMRAVTQNRRMADAMGVRTGWVDAMTFGLGAGVAGVAGVALSQIDNVSPDLGQSYIVDSFMVVVFGGVGNLWGALAGAFTLGVANKFLEPFAGAVMAKILVLVFIILFIQKRPRGLFALKGRAVEQ